MPPTELLTRALNISANYYGSAPKTIEASPWAQYLVLLSEEIGCPVTLADVDRNRKRDGYRGWPGLLRYEDEVLKPMVYGHELDVLKDAVEQMLKDLKQG